MSTLIARGRFAVHPRVGLTALLLAGCGPASAPAPSASSEPPEVIAPARDADLEPLLRDLIERHVSTAREAPQKGRARGRLGLVYEANNLWELALASYENAASLAPKSPAWPFRAAVCQITLGRLGEAERGLEQLHVSRPGFAPAWHRYGTLLLQRGAVREARPVLEHCRALAPDAPEPRVTLADCLVRLGEHAAAERLLREALATDPTYAQAHYLHGLALRGMNRQDEAREALRRGANAGPRYLEDPFGQMLGSLRTGLVPQIAYAGSLIRARQYNEAVQTLEAIRRLRPDEPDVLNNLAAAYMGLGRFDEALALLDLSLENDEQSNSTLVYRSNCLLKMGRAEDALAAAARAAELAPKLWQPELSRARALIALERWAAAEEALMATRALDPKNPVIWLALAELQLDRGSTDAARASLAELARLAPGHPRVRDLEDRLTSVPEDER